MLIDCREGEGREGERGREGGREGERHWCKREKHRLVASHMCPNRGWTLNLPTYPGQDSNQQPSWTCNLSVYRTKLQPTKPHWPGLWTYILKHKGTLHCTHNMPPFVLTQKQYCSSFPKSYSEIIPYLSVASGPSAMKRNSQECPGSAQWGKSVCCCGHTFPTHSGPLGAVSTLVSFRNMLTL